MPAPRRIRCEDPRRGGNNRNRERSGRLALVGDGHLRRAQGFVRTCTKEINTAGHEAASVRIVAAIATMRRYNRYRVPYFQDLLAQARKQPVSPEADRNIVRRPGNPMLRYVGGAVQAADADVAVPTINQESLEL